ncbi:MAG: nucleoside recognition domain-containing protein [Bacillota bacterium]|nr:nucleoside recognition domain-containing protein [Bacillota bacterium]
MTALAEPVRKGLLKSVRLLWMLTKIIVPVSCLVAILDYYGIVESVAGYFTPAMAYFGLPGAATIVLLLSFFLNFYAALGVIATLSLSAQQITILAVMIGICHELPIETVICSYTGLRIPVSAVLRIGTALAAGLLLNLIYTLALGG